MARSFARRRRHDTRNTDDDGLEQGDDPTASTPTVGTGGTDDGTSEPVPDAKDAEDADDANAAGTTGR